MSLFAFPAFAAESIETLSLVEGCVANWPYVGYCVVVAVCAAGLVWLARWFVAAPTRRGSKDATI